MRWCRDSSVNQLTSELLTMKESLSELDGAALQREGGFREAMAKLQNDVEGLRSDLASR